MRTGDPIDEVIVAPNDAGIVSWTFGSMVEADLGGVDSWVEITVGQNAQTRKRRQAQVMVDLIELSFEALGLSNTRGAAKVAVEQIQKTCPVLPIALLKEESWTETAERGVGDFISDEGLNVLFKALGTAYFKSFGPDVAGKVVIAAAIKNTAGAFWKYSMLGYKVATGGHQNSVLRGLVALRQRNGEGPPLPV
jgi:hypothetical protein